MKKTLNSRFLAISWIVSVIMIGGGYLIHPYFFLMGTVCMFTPVIIGIFRNRTANFCAYHCPRGSLLIKIVNKISFKKKMPKLFLNKWFKVFAAVALLGLFTRNMTQNLILDYNLTNFATNVGNLITATAIIAIVMGIIWFPKTWCVFCPMGTIGKNAGKAIHKRG